MRKLELRHNNATADMIAMIDCDNYRSLIGGDDISSSAREWVGNGFSADAGEWWDAGCFAANRAAELRDAGIAADQVSELRDAGLSSWGYAHSNCDVSTEQLLHWVAAGSPATGQPRVTARHGIV